QVRDLFSRFYSLSLREISGKLGEPDLKLLVQVLGRMIDESEVLRNRYGFPAYLAEDSDLYYLHSRVRGTPDYALVTYEEEPFVQAPVSFAEYDVRRKVLSSRETICRLLALRLPERGKEFLSGYYKLNESSQITLLETVVR